MPPPLDILVVDDEQNMRSTLAEILAESGYSTRTASTGEEAVELCRQLTFRLVLMDVRMQGIDGFEAFRRIRHHCKRSQIALMSAYADDELEGEALRAGVRVCLRKPLEIDVVMSLITEVTSTSVLCVGPVGADQRALHQAIVAAGFRVTFVSSLDEARDVTRQIAYDLAVVDAGAEDAQTVRAHAAGALPRCDAVLLKQDLLDSVAPDPDPQRRLVEALLSELERTTRVRLGIRSADAPAVRASGFPSP